MLQDLLILTLQLSFSLLPSGLCPFDLQWAAARCVYMKCTVLVAPCSPSLLLVCKWNIWQNYLQRLRAGVAQLIASDLEVDSWVFIPCSSSEFPVCCCLQKSPLKWAHCLWHAAVTSVHCLDYKWVQFWKFQSWDLTPCRYPEDYGCTNPRYQLAWVTEFCDDT
jgi:hypothetical protein